MLLRAKPLRVSQFGNYFLKGRVKEGGTIICHGKYSV